MDGMITYLTTDLDIVSKHSLDELATAFTLHGVPPRDVTKGANGLIYATINARSSHLEPEQDIAEMLAVVESLDASLREIWSECSIREFNIGFDCGKTPWGFNQPLSADLVLRIAAAGASLRVTIYPEEPPTSEPPR